MFGDKIFRYDSHLKARKLFLVVFLLEEINHRGVTQILSFKCSTQLYVFIC